MAQIKNITDLMVKEKWKRRIVGDNLSFMGIDPHRRHPIIYHNDEKFIEMTQQDFAREIDVNTQNVFLHTDLVPRPVFREGKDSEGNPTIEIDHFEDVCRVALGLQEYIVRTKTGHYAGEPLWFGNESGEKYDTQFDSLASHWDSSGMDLGYYDVIRSTFRTCDGAIYQYIDGKEVKFKVFSYLYGDTLYPTKDENGEDVLIRKYTYQGKTAVDLYTKDYVEMWLLNGKDDKDEKWWKRWVSWLVDGGSVTTEDGYKRVYRKKNQLSRLQVTYFRIEDIPSAPAQSAIERLQVGFSDMCEESRAFCYTMMFLKSSNLQTLPSPNSHGKVIVASGENDDIKMLEPADSSNIIPLQFEWLMKTISNATGTVFVTEELFTSGGEFSSTALKQLYKSEIQWCMDLQPTLFGATKEMVSIFKELVGIVEKDLESYLNMRVSVKQDVWIPQNSSEKIVDVTNMVYAGLLSRKAAAKELNLKWKGDYDVITEEMEFKANLGKDDSNTGLDKSGSDDVNNNNVNKGITEVTGS